MVRSSVKFLLTMGLLALMIASCAGWGKSADDGMTKVDLTIPDKIPASLLPAMAVGVDASYVFVQPDGNTSFFGPLTKEEKVNRLGRKGSWILVWIPRLRITGWVRKQQIYDVGEESSDKGSIPTKYLTIVNIIKKRVNIRKSPSTRSRIIFKARQRQEFLLLDRKKDWYQIWIPHLEKKGWVASRMVVKQGKR